MTHTLHRKGDGESLSEDYVMLVLPARGVNLEGSEEKLREIWGVIGKYEKYLANFGDGHNGNMHTTTMEKLKKANSRILHVVFKDPDTLKACLKDLKNRDFGISIVVSGLYSVIQDACKEVGLRPHTVEHSLGIHGKTERLPTEEILEFTTMCGHGMVSTNLAGSMISESMAGKITCQEGANELSRRCDCGIFNPYRAAKLLSKISNKD